MPRHLWTVFVSLAILFSFFSFLACSRTRQEEKIQLIVPAGFSGQVQLLLGVPGSPALDRDGAGYLAHIPDDGKLSTSTVLSSTPKCSTNDGAQIWGFTSSIYKTGDGLAVGGSLEFFVGTKEQYETYEARKRKSQRIPNGPTSRVESSHAVLT
jgi:hypothetical protein